MIDVFTVIWAALSVLILAALVYFVAKKKISVVAFICLLILVVLGIAGFAGLLGVGFKLGIR